MLDFELEELKQNTHWRDVLAAYQSAQESAQAQAKTSDTEFDGWLPRIMVVEGLDEDDLPRIHGKLIAWGFLKFQLASRGTGVVYQLSPAGRQALNTETNTDSNTETEDGELEESAEYSEEETDQAA